MLKYPVFVKKIKLALCNGVSLYNFILMVPSLVLKRTKDSLFNFPYAVKNFIALFLFMVSNPFSISFFSIFFSIFSSFIFDFFICGFSFTLHATQIIDKKHSKTVLYFDIFNIIQI